jgi:hypothetical protein
MSTVASSMVTGVVPLVLDGVKATPAVARSVPGHGIRLSDGHLVGLWGEQVHSWEGALRSVDGRRERSTQ